MSVLHLTLFLLIITFKCHKLFFIKYTLCRKDSVKHVLQDH